MVLRKTILCLALLAVCPPAPADEGITPDLFGPLHRMIRPQAGESKWEEVPWLTDLAEARRRSAAQDRPLFVWRSGGGAALGRC